MVSGKRNHYISLRLILTLWFIIFSIVPIGLISFYSLLKFEKAIESEQLQRLKSNAREIEVMISDFYSELRTNRDNLVANPHITFDISVGDETGLRDKLNDWVSNSEVSHISVYNRDGLRMAYSEKEYYSSIQMNRAEKEASLDAKVMDHLNDRKDFGYLRSFGSGIELVLIAKVITPSKKMLGFVEQRLLLKQNFLARIKNDLKVEMLLVNENYQMVNSLLGNFESIPPEKLSDLKKAESDSLVDITVGNETYAFIRYAVMWDQSPFQIIIGTSKKESQAVLKNVNVAFMGVIGFGVVILIVTILITTSVLLRPVNDLIKGLRAFENNDSLVQLEVQNKTEIGLLTSTFNQMSLKVYRTRRDLKLKIQELEKANQNLKEAQTQLVQSAKMTSLGQLVAGVAHELNNPIAFIYSNTSHLREYSEKLFKIVELIEKNPEQADKIKEDYEFDYIQQDLPRLIKSCQDGAQRTRDIVLGLRNFSRLEESQLKEIDLHESIDMTLELLRGETKNRIQIHREYEPIPLVHCYASQVNQVVMNILTNAVHAIEGNGHIWISTHSIKASTNEVGKVQLSIRDSGTGMSAEVVEKIFEPFFTTKDVGQGTGLGLSISYGIIQNHGGDIQVKSKLGQGTEFIITIPVMQIKKSEQKNVSL